MNNETYANITTNGSLEMTNSDQEIITVNKYKLIDVISNLLAVGFIFGIMIGATIMQLIIRFS